MRILASLLLSLLAFVVQADARRIVYVFDADFPPHTWVRNGEVRGFDVDLLRLVLEGSDTELELRPMQWGDAQQALAEGRVHITSGMAKTPERLERYVFSDLPVADFKLSLFVPQGSPVRNLRDLARDRVATQRGSLYQKVLEERGFTPILYETEAEALIAVARGDADAFLGAEKTVWFNIREHRLIGLMPVATPLRVSSLYFVMRRDDPELHALIDRGLRRAVADGSYNRLYREWFVPELTAEETRFLLAAAREAAYHAYAPYSGFQVGAAVMTHGGRIYTGANVENALLGYSESAMKVAILKAVSEGDSHIRAAVNYLPDGRAGAPAAAERQILHEFAPGALVVMGDQDEGYRTVTVTELLPFAFSF